jgi:hypothetical protein
MRYDTSRPKHIGTPQDERLSQFLYTPESSALFLKSEDGQVQGVEAGDREIGNERPEDPPIKVFSAASIGASCRQMALERGWLTRLARPLKRSGVVFSRQQAAYADKNSEAPCMRC